MLFYSLGLLRAVPILLFIAFSVRVVSRWFIFKKMEVMPVLSLIPGVGEYYIFKKCWVVWPYFLLLILTFLLGFWIPISGYMDINLPIPLFIKTRMQILSLVTFVMLSIFMNKRLSFAFGHDILYTIGLLFFNPVFLAMLAFSKDRYHKDRAELYGKDFIEYKINKRDRVNSILSIVSAMVIVFASVLYVGQVVRTEHMPSYFIYRNNNKIYDRTAGKVSGMGTVVRPKTKADPEIEDGIRELYYPEKADMSEITVFMYMIGSDLEDTNGSASINIRQMIDATKAGDKLQFILEAGGSGRWFTHDMRGNHTCRYLIKNGRMALLVDLGSGVSMSEPETLSDFIEWGNEKYATGRKMLFLWDHGGGVSGFGYDKINPRKGETMISLPEISKALAKEGTKYDIIGFDACLMQTLEVGLALEPYADYLLASEEGEPNSGLYYTAAFSRLAEDPALDSEEFGSMMCSSYDQSLELINGFPQAGATLSLVDLRYIPSIYRSFSDYLKSLDDRFREDRDSFINMSTARFRAYEFQMNDQIDLVDFIEESKMADPDKQEMIDTANRAIVVRNSASARRINGLAVYMPYDDLRGYTEKRKIMNSIGMKSMTKSYNDFASIIGSQKFNKDKSDNFLIENEDWYVKAFKEYDASSYKTNIDLIKHDNDDTNYVIDLTEDEWKNITNYELGLRIKIGDRYADMGSDNIYDRDENDHPMVGFDKTWVAINDTVVALKPGTPIKADNDTIIYTGTVDATMNFITPITIYMQWVNVGDNEGDGEVVGYMRADEVADNFDEHGMPRGYKTFKPNTILTFLYDWYDKEGNYLTTAMGHLPTRVGYKGLKVTQKDISSTDFEYYGILYDVMNRTLKTEKLIHEKE